MPADDLQIPSYRVVFELDRRIHRIDRYRIPLPYGLPLRSVAYACIALGAVLVLQRLPVIGAPLALLPIPVRFVLLPAVASYLLTQVRLDGRSAHRALAAWLQFKTRPRDLVAFRAAARHERVTFGDVLLASDDEAATIRKARITGPCVVTFLADATTRRRMWRRSLVEPSRPGDVVHLGAGESLLVR